MVTPDAFETYVTAFLVIYLQELKLVIDKDIITGDFLRKEHKSPTKLTSENLKSLKFYYGIDSIVLFGLDFLVHVSPAIKRTM